MRFLATVALLPLLTFPAHASPPQDVPVPCALAERVDLSSFTLLGAYDDSEIGQDSAAYAYAECQSRALTRDLARMPQLSARLVTLRSLYRQLNGADGDLAAQIEGGGTMYSHGIPRSYPDIEATLRTLAALAGSRYGASVGPQFTASIRASKQALAARLSLLAGWKPSGAASSFDPASYRAALDRYRSAASAIQKLLGSQNNAATAAGYLPLGGSLFLDDALNNND